MLKLFDPTLDVDEEEDTAKKQQLHNLIPLYQKPIVNYCVLPGELNYLHVRKPDLRPKMELARKEPNYVI